MADGSTIITNYNADYTYTFSPAGTVVVGTNAVITGTVVGTPYKVTATLGTCSSVASLPFTNAAMLPTPAVPTITTTPATCSAASISSITNYNAANTYTFSSAGTVASSVVVGTGGVITGTVAGTSYTVTATLGTLENTCSSGASASFTNAAILPVSAPTATVSVQPTCTLATGTITVTTVIGLEYKLDGGAYQTSGTFAGVASGSHTITAKNALGCESPTTSVTIDAQPASAQSPTITGSTTVCSGETLNLTATGVGTHAWVGPSFTAASAAISISNSLVANSGTYTVTLTNADGCSATVTTLVTINPRPVTPTAQANVNTPIGTSITLTATGCEGTILWYKTSNNSSVTMPITPTDTASYYAKCSVTTNSVTCIGQASGNVFVSVGPMLVVSIKTGNWEDPSTWNVGRLPLITEEVKINFGHLVTITTPSQATAKKVVYQLGATIRFADSAAKLILGSL